MSAAEGFGSLRLIADTSVWTKLRQAPPDLFKAFDQALHSRQIVGSPVVRLEWLHDAQNGAEFDERDRNFSALQELPLTREVGMTALTALRELRSQGSPGYHRVNMGDALIAATAQVHVANVLHDDCHFGKLSDVLNFVAIRFGPIPEGSGYLR